MLGSCHADVRTFTYLHMHTHLHTHTQYNWVIFSVRNVLPLSFAHPSQQRNVCVRLCACVCVYRGMSCQSALVIEWRFSSPAFASSAETVGVCACVFICRICDAVFIMASASAHNHTHSGNLLLHISHTLSDTHTNMKTHINADTQTIPHAQHTCKQTWQLNKFT